MSVNGIGDLLARAHALAGKANTPSPETSERERLTALASEFESMLLLQMLKEMRKAGSWDDDGDADTLGADTLFETLDVELAKYLAEAQTLGLRKELLQAFDRKYGTGATDQDAVPASVFGAATVDKKAGRHEMGVAASSSAAALVPIPSRSVPLLDDVGDGMDALTRPTGKVTSAFGWRADPFNGTSRFHGGIDVRAAYGQDVASAGAGRVVSSGDERGYGTTVVVEHADGVRTRYAHLSAALVKAGDAVAARQVLGRVGQSGRATGAHLHFEVIANGVRVDPASLTSPALKLEGIAADLAVRRTTFPETE